MPSREAACDLDHTKFGPNTIARFFAVILLTAECSSTCQERKKNVRGQKMDSDRSLWKVVVAQQQLE